MFLRNIRLQNVRCIEDAEISFDNGKGNRKWTLLVGDNGSGKSTLLKAMALLMCGSEALLDVLQDPGSWVRNGTDEARITGEITTAGGRVRRLSLKLRRDQTFRELLKENARGLKQLDDALDYTTRSYLTIGYGASRHTHHAGGTAGEQVYHHPRVRAVSTLFAEHAQMISLESWAMDLFHNPKLDGLAMVHEALAGLLPGVTFKTLDRKTRSLIFNTPDGAVPLEHLSGGYRSVVGLCGDLLYRITEIFGDYKNPFNARGLLLIDELGLHLHPRWQRVLMDFLTHRLPNFQIVCTTNAPLTAHQAGEGELYYLKRQGARKPPTLHRFTGSPNMLLLHQLILSPVFGIDTANSREVEMERKEHKKLKSKTRKTAGDKKRMKALEASLAEASDWEPVPQPDQKKLTGLLRKIDKRLAADGTRS